MVRSDLSLAQQLVQAAHATLECGIYHSGIPPKPDNIVLPSVGSEQELRAEFARITEAGVQARLIEEPDIGDQATAMATEPMTGSSRKLFSNHRLWKQPIPHALVANSQGPAPHAGPGGATPPRSSIHALVAQ